MNGLVRPLPPLPLECRAELKFYGRKIVLTMTKCYALKLLEPYLTEEELEELKNNWARTRIRFPVAVRAFENVKGQLVIELIPAKSSPLSIHKSPNGSLARIKLTRVLRGIDLSKYRQISYYLVHDAGRSYVIFTRIERAILSKNRKYFDTPYRFRPGEGLMKDPYEVVKDGVR